MLDPASLLRPDSADRGDLVTDMAIELIERGGVQAVTLRSLGECAGVTPSGVLRWFVDSADMWRVIVSRFGNRWCGWLDSRARPDPARDPLDPARLSSLLPLTPQELGWTRVWLALVELGRTRPHLAHRIAWVEQRERELAARMLAQALSADSRAVGPHVDSTVALVWGLRHAVCAPVEAMPLECAHELLDAHVEGLRHALTQR